MPSAAVTDSSSSSPVSRPAPPGAFCGNRSRLHRARADIHRRGPPLGLVDVRLHFGVGQGVGRARRTGRGGEDDADHVAVEVDQWSTGVARHDLRLDDPDTAHHLSLTIDIATCRLDLTVDHRGTNLLLIAAWVANRGALGARARIGLR